MNSTPPGTSFRSFDREARASDAIPGSYFARKDAIWTDVVLATASSLPVDRRRVCRALIEKRVLDRFAKQWPVTRCQRGARIPRVDQLLQAGEASFGDCEATRIMRHGDNAKEAEHERQWRETDH